MLLGNMNQPFNIRLNGFVTDMRGFGHSNHHFKIMHISVKKTYFRFPINGNASSMRLTFESVAKMSQSLLQILLKLKKNIGGYRVSK